MFKTSHVRSSVPFPTFPTACLYVFIISARVFLERAMHALFRSRKLFQIRLYMRQFIISVSVFVERAIHDLFVKCHFSVHNHALSVPTFSKRVLKIAYYFGLHVENEPYVQRSSVPFPTFPTACLCAFI